MYIIVKFENEYTAFMMQDKIYMVKGLTDNLDNIISYKELPVVTTTAIIPFKGYLIYDGILQNYSINMGPNFSKMIEGDYNKLMKYYHL